MNFFCGEHNCYDLLEVNRSADLSEIKSAYRTAALKAHPDKNPGKDTAAMFRLVKKAKEILVDEEKRELFDYYLDNPRSYYKVTGHFIYKLPKANIGVVVAIVVVLLSLLTHYTQLHKHENKKKELRAFVINESGKGNEQTEQLFKEATDKYAELFKGAMAAKGQKKVNLPGRAKMLSDPIFAEAVKEVVDEIQFEGGARKPTLQDLFAYRLVMWPYHSVVAWRQYYLYEIKGQEPATHEEKEDIAMRRVGSGTWMMLPESERKKLLKDGIYKASVYNEWYAKEERKREIAREVYIEKKKRKLKAMGYDSDEIEEEFQQ